MNQYSLRHPSTIAKIDKAMRDSVQMSAKTTSKLGWSLVKNTKGETLMHVRHSRIGQMSYLMFFDRDLQDISDTVKKALRSAEK